MIMLKWGKGAWLPTQLTFYKEVLSLSTLKKHFSSYLTLFGTFFKIGLFVFGGGYAMLPLIEEEVVNGYQWMTEEEFIDMLAITQSAPGPVAVNASIFIGFKMMGISGAIVALLGATLPSFIIILLLATLLATQSEDSHLQRFFAGVRPAIIALILGVGIRTGRKVIRTPFSLLIFGIALSLLLIFNVHPVLLIILGGLTGALVKGAV